MLWLRMYELYLTPANERLGSSLCFAWKKHRASQLTSYMAGASNLAFVLQGRASSLPQFFLYKCLPWLSFHCLFYITSCPVSQGSLETTLKGYNPWYGRSLQKALMSIRDQKGPPSQQVTRKIPLLFTSTSHLLLVTRKLRVAPK